MTDDEAAAVVDARVALFEREIAALAPGASWADHQAAIARAVRGEVEVPADA